MQGSATPGTRANLGTRGDFIRHATLQHFSKNTFLNVKIIKNITFGVKRLVISVAFCFIQAILLQPVLSSGLII